LVIVLVLCDGALRAMRSVLSRVGAYDVATIRLVVLMLAAVTFLAATIPTLRVAGIELAEMLREKYNGSPSDAARRASG
jgi:hypothetical protein